MKVLILISCLLVLGTPSFAKSSSHAFFRGHISKIVHRTMSRHAFSKMLTTKSLENLQKLNCESAQSLVKSEQNANLNLLSDESQPLPVALKDQQ